MNLPSKELSESRLDSLIEKERTRVVAPLTEWRTLSLELEREGLMGVDAGRSYTRDARPSQFTDAGDDDISRARRRRSPVSIAVKWAGRIAASAMLVGAGFLVGEGMTFGKPIADSIVAAIGDSIQINGVSVGSGRAFKNPDQAKALLAQSQANYQRAAAYLAASDTSHVAGGNTEMYRDRLAALDEVTESTVNALHDAPDDPILNQYYLSAVAAREATIQQLGRSLPDGRKVIRF